MTLNEVYNRCMPIEKRKKEKMNIWVAWVVRPLSVICTVPLVNTKIRPSDVTILSIIFSCLGFILMSIAVDDISLKICGWLCFFIWAILDGVDGNLARCQNTCSPLGELWDAVGGYASMVLIYMAAGITAFFDINLISLGPNFLILIVAGFSSLFSLFPRLIMHKKNSIIPPAKNEKALNDKSSYGIREIIIMNVISVSGFMQVLFLISILFHLLNVFTFFYAFVNLLVMIISLHSMLKNKRPNEDN